MTEDLFCYERHCVIPRRLELEIYKAKNQLLRNLTKNRRGVFWNFFNRSSLSFTSDAIHDQETPSQPMVPLEEQVFDIIVTVLCA